MKRLLMMLLFPAAALGQQVISVPWFPTAAAAPGESTYVATVTRGTLTFASGKDTLNSWQVSDPSKTVVWTDESYGNVNTASNLVAVRVLSDRIAFEIANTTTSSPPTVGWQKVVKTRGWKVYHLDTTFTYAAAPGSITFNIGGKIDSSMTYVLVNGCNEWGNPNGTHFLGSPQLFPTDSTVQIRWLGTIGDGRLTVQVVEDSNCTVQRLYGSGWSRTTTSQDITISSAEPLQTILIPIYSYSNESSDSVGSNLLHFHHNTATNVRWTRSLGVSSHGEGEMFCLQAVTFTDATVVDTLTGSFGTAATAITVTHDDADYTHSAVIATGFRNMAGKIATLSRVLSTGLVRNIPIDATSFQSVREVTGSLALTTRYNLIRYNTKELLP